MPSVFPRHPWRPFGSPTCLQGVTRFSGPDKPAIRALNPPAENMGDTPGKTRTIGVPVLVRERKSLIGLIQRVSQASVMVDGIQAGAIDEGSLLLLGVEKHDSEAEADRLLERVLGYRIFADPEGRMNLSLADTGGGLLIVPQFTLAANTRKGMRASFTSAASPAEGERLYEYFVSRARARHESVATGVFGAHMQVGLVNDGPVTFWLHVTPGQ